jgi:hypothetical protein
MEATQQTYQGQASPESVWAILREVAELQRETAPFFAVEILAIRI